jgi:cytochrome c oxidase cbb3-type subunit 4
MNPLWGHVIGIVTLVVMLTFLGVWAWIWLPQHQRKFEALARLPMEDGEAKP